MSQDQLPRPPVSSLGGKSRGVSYILMGLAGVAVFILTPTTIEYAIGVFAVYLWGGLLVPGLIAGVSAFHGRYRWEYPILPLLIAGLVVYALTLWVMVTDTPTRLAQTLIITAFVHKLVGRFLDLRNLVNADKDADPDMAEEG